MTQEQLMKVKIKYLEDRITTMEKSLGRINNILGRFQMTENKEQGFKDIEIYESVGGGFDFDDEPTSKDNDNELI
jgi:hypothetical protein